MKDYRISLLADYYGVLLPPRVQDALSSYYDHDLSLAEIAERFCISRQAVSEMLSKAAEQLDDFESKLKLVERGAELATLVSQANDALQSGDRDRAAERLERIKQRI